MILLTSKQIDTRQDFQTLINYSYSNRTMVHVLLFLLLLPEYLSHIYSVKRSSDLNKYLCDPDYPLLTDTQLLLSPNVNHILSSRSFCLVSNISNITLRSTSITPAIITCRHYNNSYESVGFGFYNVSGLMIENVHITQCGGPMPSTSTLYPNDTAFYFHEGQSVTLFVSYSSHIMMFGVNINNYYGFAILLININNNVTLKNINITFTSGSAQCSEKVLTSCGGSGLIVYFSNLDNRIGVLEAHVLVNNTIIKGNWNFVPYTDINIAAQVDGKEPKAISAFAAGMTVIFSLGNYTANVLLSHGYWNEDIGGVFDGLAIIFSDAPVGNTSVTVTNSRFIHNIFQGKVNTFRIGCLFTATYKNEYTHHAPWDILTISDSTISDNGDSITTDNGFNSYITPNIYNHPIVHIITSSTESIYLTIHLDHLKYIQSYNGIRNPFILSESKKNKTLNVILQSLKLYELFWSSSVNLAFNSGKLVFVNTNSVYINKEGNLFKHITGSVIQAYNSDIHLNGSLYFHDNKASHGAAFRLDSLSLLFIHESTNASFVNNHASFYGGAIYSHIDRNLPTINPLCAIQIVSQNISQLNAKMIFKNNTAKLAGNSIYMSPLYDCQQLYLKEVNSSVIYQTLFHFEAKNNNVRLSEISSVPVSTYRCNVNNSNNNTGQIEVYPGETITIGLQAYDLNAITTYAQIIAKMTKLMKRSNHTFSMDLTYLLPVAQQIQTVYSNSCTSLHFTIFSESISGIMYLHFEVLGYSPTTQVKLISKHCPPGFIYSSDNKACVCSSFLKQCGITQCNIDTSTINIPFQSWLGVVDDGTIIGYSEHCPLGHCAPNTTIIITQPDIMCRGNRMGWLCGQCKEGYSIVLGSTDCYQCSNTLHSALAISFGILGGIVYVLVLFSLRLTIDLGTLGGFIFWLNIIWPYAIPSSEVSIKNTHLQYMVYILTSIKYQWNIPMCITNDLNELEKIAITYFFPFYFWIMVAVIVLLSRCSTRIANLIVGSSVQVLVTLMYISYSELLSTSLIVLTPAQIHYNSTKGSAELLVWFRDGSVLYGQSPFHIVLLCVSIVVISLFIVPFTLVGLFGVKMLRSRFIAKYFRPFIDAIHGPYKDNLRYWFGLRLIVMSLVYIVNAVLQGNNMTLQLVLSLIILGSFTFAEVVFLPFKSRILNALDLWFMILLLFNIHMNLSYSSSETIISLTTTITIVLSFVTFFIILLYHSYLSMSRFRCIRKCVQYLYVNGNFERIKKIFRKSRARSRDNLMPPLREDDSYEYEEW